jgi:D-alanine-D-alanine ligase
MRKRIAILTGGTSSEREVALSSAKTVEKVLAERYEIMRYVFPEEMGRFLSEKGNVDIAIRVFHGRGGEDGCIQGFLNTLGVKFLFSDVEAQAVAADKWLAKKIAAGTGVKTPRAEKFSDRSLISFNRPIVIKPIDGGSSVGVSVVKDSVSLSDALDSAFREADEILAEDLIEGEEYTVPVIEVEDGVKALPVIYIKPKSVFFDFASKYDASLSEEICPAPIPDELSEELQAQAINIHNAIGARHMSRSDFIVDKDGTPWFLEINTIPGMTENSLLPKALKTSGLDFGSLFAGWIENT